MKVVRTVSFPIKLTQVEEEVLHGTLNLYSRALSHCIDVAWEMPRPAKTSLHKKTYYHLKQALCLKAQFLCSARDLAFESVRSARKLQCNRKKVSKPTIKKVKIRLDGRTLSFDKERTIASIATQQKRIKVKLNWHEQALRYKDWHCQSGGIGLNRNGKFVLLLHFEKAMEQKPERTGKVIGLDRGIRHAAVTSNNLFLGKAVWREHERKLRSLWSRLQAKGTKSSKRHLKKLSGRRRRFRNNCDRTIAKQLLSILVPGDTVVLEKLTDIRERCGKKGQARKKHRANMGRWSFRRLENAINYGAQLYGIYVEYVDPAYTSQMCSACKIVLKKNRKTQSRYSCSCGLTLNADLNAARNIENLWRVANGYTSGPHVNRPIVASA